MNNCFGRPIPEALKHSEATGALKHFADKKNCANVLTYFPKLTSAILSINVDNQLNKLGQTLLKAKILCLQSFKSSFRFDFSASMRNLYPGAHGCWHGSSELDINILTYLFMR